MIQETVRLDDPVWRWQNLYCIKDKSSRVCRLKFNTIQGILRDRIVSQVASGGPVDLDVLKFRQGGVSTFMLIVHLDRTIWNRNTNTGILADLRENLGYLFEIVRFAHETMPDSLRPTLGDDNKYCMSFPDRRSKIFVSLEIKSTSLHGLHISEHAHMEEEKVLRTLGAATPGAWITSETTANGMNHYERRRRSRRDSGRPSLFLEWPLQQEYRIAGDPITRNHEELALAEAMERKYGLAMDDDQFRWRRKMKRDLGRLFPQECAEDEESCFLSTGGAFFDNRKIMVLLREAEQRIASDPPLEAEGDAGSDTGRLLVFERPTPRCYYVAGADVAEGINSGEDRDYSVLTVLCTKHRRMAYRYRARIAVDTFYRHCDRVGRDYNRALLAPEVNGTYGGSMLTGLKDVCKYPNLYFEESSARSLTPKTPPKRTCGWETTPLNKEPLLTQFSISLQGKSEEDESSFRPDFEATDPDLLRETLNVVQEGVKINAGKGSHDDIVMAYAIAYQLYKKAMGRSVDLSRFWSGGQLDSAAN